MSNADVSARELAEWLGVSDRVVRDLAQREVIEKAGKGRYPLRNSILAYCEHLRGIAAGRSGDSRDDTNLTKERSLLVKSQREALELKNAASRRELVNADEVVAEWQDILSLVRANMLTVPIMAQQRLPHLTKHDVHVIDEVMRDMLTRSADDDRSSEFIGPEEEDATGA